MDETQVRHYGGKVLRPEMTATLRVFLEGGRDAFCLPNHAVQVDVEGSYVLLRGSDGAPQRQSVTLGFRGREFTEVIEGLTPSDRVLVAQ